ncbi:MAG: helix-turn-helix domain-containing protein [Chitinivibrionales bacterium]|nr:helix-turn-helix domain-containing protein [Chitinivibrionales bacterium]
MDIQHFVCTQPEITQGDDLRIARLGIREQMPAEIIDRPTGNIDFLFMHFHTPCLIDFGGRLNSYPANTFMLWAPGGHHRYGAPDLEWTHSWIHFAGSAATKRIRARTIPWDTPLELRDSRLIDRYLGAIHTEIAGHARVDPVIILNLLDNWLREIERALTAPGGAEIPRELMEVKTYIDTHYRDRLRLADLAAMAYLSVPRFCARFKNCFGLPAIDYAVRLRMQQAAFLLRDINLRIGDIAREVGYDDVYHFSKLFSKHHGRSPRRYRREMLDAAGG